MQGRCFQAGKSKHDFPVHYKLKSPFLKLKTNKLLPGGCSHLVLLSYVIVHKHVDLSSSVEESSQRLGNRLYIEISLV